MNAKPLSGLTILVTRANQPWLGPDSLQISLEQLGATVLSHPMIEIGPASDSALMDAAIDRIEDFDWIVFVSGNGVHFFVERIKERVGDIAILSSLKCATIGDTTAGYLKRIANQDSQLSPKTSNSQSLATALISSVDGGRVLLVRGNRGSDVLANELLAAHVEFEEIVAYESYDVTQASLGNQTLEIQNQLNAGQIDWVTISSSAIAQSVIELFGESLRNCKTVTISPTTSEVMRTRNFEPSAEAREFNLAGMVDAILRDGE
ncbi:MAG: uroporphyrinogen-III synthase [Mariniblastus sp.]